MDHWISDEIGDSFNIIFKSATIEEVCKDRVEKFLRDKKRFFDLLKEGYYDQTIKRVIDIKALPSSEKPVSYTEKETATIMSRMRSSQSFRTGSRNVDDQKKNKKPTKKKQESNWYLNLQSHSPF